ncbi:MAG TPA: ABC transporter ATP-binding protein [Deltaproteobacteria bacterium]|nr:ABC transporter ATP-binding protein [Deltaproteobacteria bacterium]HNS90255.1 ABC transporter ATP-binding protein [Deltaproteobacteria bacterium]HOA44967.1 ABC transporter ATP-binding protein [Deltaproteobacteria bacterium]HOC74514.1 ABC transporter ATP-binding protein [Deltaproteobacteria bacterium]HOY74806.1 ABC transporter ATP-binding protein [Deltaproteobacteria bacterium]
MDNGGTMVVEFEMVSFAYDGITVIEDVSFGIERGDFLSIVGPNGGGKTTILKLMLGLFRPRTGEVRVFGDQPEKARSRIGYMPQNTSLDPLFPVSVKEVVLMGRLGASSMLGFYSRADRVRAEEALDMVEMKRFMTRPFSSLSGGQSQRVLLARALVTQPELLILDEPTSSVDMAVESELYELLRKLNEAMTIVLVTHDLGFVSKYVKNVACVNRRLVSHPTCDISGETISAIYGHDMHMIRHDAISGRGHRHD